MSTSVYETGVIRLGGSEDTVSRADRLFRMYHPRLVGYVTRLCGKRAIAEDVVGDVWEAVCKDLSSARASDEEMFGWLAGIARHRLYRVYEHHARETPSESVAETAAAEGDAGGYVFYADLPAWLADAVWGLPPTQRSVMMMTAEGIPTTAAASWLDKTPSAVRNARRSAVQHLRPVAGAHRRHASSCGVAGDPRMVGGCLTCGCVPAACADGCGCGCGCCPYPYPLPAVAAGVAA